MRRESLTREGFPRTWAALESGVAEGVAPGFVVGVWRMAEPSVFRTAAHGQRRIHPSPQPLDDRTVFDFASVSKVFSTATLTALLVDRGWLKWDTPVRALIPSYQDTELELRHLLSHTAGLPWWMPLWEKLRERFHPKPIWEIPIAERQAEARRLVLAVPREAPIGEKMVYSDITFLTLGFALENLLGQPLDVAMRRFLWDPMGIDGVRYHRVDSSVEKGRIETIAATENCPWRGGVVQGQVHDDNCWAMGGYAGHAGVFGEIADLMKFSARLCSGFLSDATLRAAWSRVPGFERTLGWDTPSAQGSSVGSHFSTRTIGHLGFTGTSLWIDLDAGLAVGLLSNRVHPSRENIKIRAFRPAFHDALRLDLREWSH